MAFSHFFAIITFAALLYTVQGTKVRQCQFIQGKVANDSVTISACEAAPCKLRKKSDVLVSVKFTPENDIEKFVTLVHIKLVGIPFPFIGVDGVSACGKVFEMDGKTKASCPLKKGKQYIYQNSFKVLELYPTVRGVVHWSLHDAERKVDVACFEILVKIG
uniref:Putative major epididymal secretory protein he1 n=1 Tax=Panstrongylus lignarius TaxID=156445 RepID=A0A224XZQ1_9HEMI